MKGYLLEPWASRPLTPLAQVMRRVWGGEVHDWERRLGWQYLQAPRGAAVVVVARERQSGELVGQFAGIPLDVHAGARRLIATLLVNAAVVPEHRRRGVLGALGAAVARACDGRSSLLFGFPNPSSEPSLVRALGARSVAADTWLRPLSLRRAPRLVMTVLGVPVTPTPLRSLGRGIRLPREVAADGIRRIVDGDDPALDGLGAVTAADATFAVVRGADFLRWRYFSAPTHRYVFLVAREDGRDVAYLVLGASPLGGSRLGIVMDFQMEATARGAAGGRRLLSAAVASARAAGVDVLVALASHESPQGEVLRTARFWRGPTRLAARPVRCIVKHEPADALVLPGDGPWYPAFGDFDMF